MTDIHPRPTAQSDVIEKRTCISLLLSVGDLAIKLVDWDLEVRFHEVNGDVQVFLHIGLQLDKEEENTQDIYILV